MATEDFKRGKDYTWTLNSPAEHEAMNVYTLDDNRCVKKMIKKNS